MTSLDVYVPIRSPKSDLHVLVNDSAWLGEGPVRVLSADHPIRGATNHLVIDEDVLLGLVEGLHNEGAQPMNICKSHLLYR
jgi:hypothetical protein